MLPGKRFLGYRCIQRCEMTGENAKAKSIFDTINQDAIATFRLHYQIAIAPKNQPMPIHGPANQTQSCAILAPILLQAACIILHSLVRLITSDNDIASIMDMMPVSISRVIGSSFDHATLARWLCFTILWAEHERRWSRHGPKESLILWRGEATGGLPHAPQRDSSQRGNPSPHKNSYFLCQ